jgi:hypothetical protein
MPAPAASLATTSYKLYDPQHRTTGGPRTLVGHRTSRVLKAYKDAIAHGRIEAAVHWSGELVISGNVWPVWEALFAATAMYYYNHQQMAVYLADRYRRFRQVATGTADIDLRNVDMVRSIVAETSAVLASGDRRFKATRTAVAEEMFALDHLRPHMRAPSRDLARPYALDADPPEVLMCANELAHALAHKQLGSAQFWVEWLLEWQRRCIKLKAPCVCGLRGNGNLPEKVRSTPALLLWAVLRGTASVSPRLDTTVAAWEELFGARYTGKVNTTRTLLLLAGVYAVCNRDTLNPSLPITNPALVPSIVRGLPQIYKRLAQQAALEFVAPRTMQEGNRGGTQRRGGGGDGGSASTSPGDTVGLLRLISPMHHH